MSGKAVLKSNCLILFGELQKAVDNYLDHGHTRGEVQYIDAFLTATIHSFIDYADGHLDPNKTDNEFNACRYANNFRHGVKFCVSEIRQSQGWRSENRANWRLEPFLTTRPGGQDGMRAAYGVNAALAAGTI